jgi:predicted RNA binding protein YcfA (HicA-like mRNA interferase family)
MPKRRQLTGKQVMKGLKAHGWMFDRMGKGDHHIYIDPQTRHTVSVPDWGAKPIKQGTIDGILDYAGITFDDLILGIDGKLKKERS